MRILEREGYYNIINGYKEIFLDMPRSAQRGEDYYKDGISFDHVYSLYEFDRKLRSHLIAYILRMETNLKTKIAYAFSERFKQNFSYLDINNYDASDPQKVTKLIARISSVITKNSQQQDQGGQIFHYLDKYKELPLWVLINKMTMGEAYHFYDALQKDMQENIVSEMIESFEREYGRKVARTGVDLSSNISNMVDLAIHYRNICAHEERLYNTIIKRRNGKIPQIILFHHIPPLPSKSKVYDCILIVGLFIPKKEYKRLLAGLVTIVEDLEKKLPQNLFNNVLIHMGFSKDWKESLRLDQ